MEHPLERHMHDMQVHVRSHTLSVIGLPLYLHGNLLTRNQAYRNAMREFRRVLKLNGRLVVCTTARRPIFQVGPCVLYP